MRNAKPLADGLTGSWPDHAMSRNRRLGAPALPDVVTPAMTVKPSAVAPQPPLELPTFHSVERTVVGAIQRRSDRLGDLTADRQHELLEPIEHCLDRECGTLS